MQSAVHVVTVKPHVTIEPLSAGKPQVDWREMMYAAFVEQAGVDPVVDAAPPGEK